MDTEYLGPIALLVCFAGIFGFVGWVALGVRREQQRIRATGLRGTATVRSCQPSSNRRRREPGLFSYRVSLDINVPGRDPFPMEWQVWLREDEARTVKAFGCIWSPEYPKQLILEGATTASAVLSA